MRLEHVNLTVSNLDRSIAFYCELFGFRVRWRGETASGQPAAHVGDDRSYLALFEALSPGVVDAETDRVGFNHYGLVVDDLDAMRKRLERLGVTPHLEADYEPGVRLYFFDPDGFEVELVQYGSPDADSVKGRA